MPRLKKETQIKRVQSSILEFLEKQGHDTEKIELPLMTDEEQLYEAQAVLNYFESNGENFHYETCSSCGMQFVYAYSYNGIKTCSIECMRDNLRRIGLDWHYGRSLKMRWGRYYPAVVPGYALAAIQDDVPEQLNHHESPKDP